MIQKAFWDFGVTLPVDGNRDYELQIKGFVAGDFKIEASTETKSNISNDSHGILLRFANTG